MSKEKISDKQGIATLVLFIIGTSIIYASGIKAKNDIWIAIIISILAAFPFTLLYARLHNIFPGKNLFDIYVICYGKYMSKVIIIVYTWFFFHTGILVLMNLNLFINTVALTNTPRIVTMMCIVILCTWIVKEGVEVVTRWAKIFRFLFVGLIVITLLLLIPEMEIENIQPVLYYGWNPVLKGAFGTFAFPFTQIMVFTIIFKDFKTKKSPYKVYTRGLLIGGLIILVISTVNILVLGVDLTSSTYYPSHESSTKVAVGAIIQRTEIVMSVSFVIGAFIKSSIYLLAATKGISKIFKYSNYRFIVIPISLLMINLSYFLHDSIMDYFHWILNIWTYYSIPFQIILPIIVWITAEIKKNTSL